MDAEVACARCWRVFSSASDRRIPRLLNCGHSLCTECVDTVLQNGSRKVLACPKCGKAHAVSGGSKSSAVPQNLALVDSLRRLQLNPTLGGLLVVENVHITAQQINTSSNSAVFVSLLQLQSQQLQVAVKKLPTSQVPPAEFKQLLQFLETLAFATTTCCKLCRLLGFTVVDGTICQVLPLYPQSLQQLLLAGGPISLPESAGIALQIVQGLQELHSYSIVHKALKPSNILLDPTRHNVVLSDFAVSAELHKLQAYVPASKPFVLYTAPELLDDEPSEAPGPACDIWSLAAVFLHCLTGKLPYEGEKSVFRAVLAGKRPYAIPRTLPQQLQTLLAQCFESDPNERPDLVAIKQLSPCVSTVQAFHNIKLPVQSQIPKVLQQALEVVLASAGNARWSPSAMQLAMAQHPPQDPFALLAAQPAQLQNISNAPLQQQQQQQQQQQGPQVDILLQRSMQAAQQAAKQQVPSIKAVIDKLSVALPRPVATVDRDLQPLDPHSAIFQELEAVMVTAKEPVKSISRVNVPDRQDRFRAWNANLPGHLQTVSRVFHGTKATSAQSIARKGPDFTLIGSANGHWYGRGFYTTTFIDTAVSYATSTGVVCVCAATLGNIKRGDRGCEDDTAGSLLKEGYHSVVAASNRITVLFHPDSVHVEYIINDVADTTAEKALAAKQAQLDVVWKQEDLVRQKELQDQQGRLKAVSHFTGVCASFLGSLQTDKAGLDRMHRQFSLEAGQFQQALPIYASKPDFLQLLKQAQCIVLKGAAGTGKSVSVPQWVYDAADPARKVVVLLSQASTAQGLAQYTSQLRRCTVGQEVGLGIAGKAEMSDSSRIVFMTYSFFGAISASDKHFSIWAAVVLDDAHERTTQADAIFLRLTAACQARKDFQMVVMSAFIDPGVFSRALRKVNVPVRVLDVAGVVFPIKDVWWCEQSWDPSARGAIQLLALECVRVYIEEKQGNVLVFMSTVAGVNELVQAVCKALAHDPGCIVLGLYADMNDDEKARVTSFHDLSKFPQNRQKRLICVATDLAESGVTIPGVTAVLETGWQNQPMHDPATRSTFMKQTRISKATQQRRRGLAGHSACGTCYTLYTQACFHQDFPDHSPPEALRSNLDAFLLGLVASGLKADDSLQLMGMQQARSNLDSSERHLLKIGAITKAANGDLKATQLGQVLASLPVSLEFGISIAAAVQHKCSHEVAVIACMATAAGNRVFQSDCQPAQSAFAAKSGDPETYLNIFEAWLGTNKNTGWCSQHRLISSALTAAEGLLTTVLAAMARSSLSDVSFASSHQQTSRSDAIMQSLTMGFFQQTATSAGPGMRSQGQFFITDDYLTNPTSALLHNRSTLNAAASSAGMVLFFSRSMLADGRHVIAGVGQIQSDWVVTAARFDPQLASHYAATIQATDRKQFHVVFSSMPQNASDTVIAAYLSALNSNVENLRKLFPLAAFELGTDEPPPILLVTCPTTLKPNIKSQIDTDVRALSVGTCTLPFRPSQTDRSHQSSGALPAAVQQLQQKLQGQVMQVEYRAGTVEVVITAFQNVLPSVQRVAYACLGLGAQPNAPQATPTQPAAREQQVVSLLQRGAPADILASFGRGKAGSLLALGRLVLATTPMWLYGGFIRDLVLRADVYDSQDLDVGLPYDGLDAGSGMSSIAMLADTIGMHFLRTHPRGDPRVVRGFFMAVDSSVEIEVQVVNTQGFPKSVDFDVNNLKITESKGIEIKYVDGQRKEATDLKQIVANARSKQLYVLKPATQLNARIEKMRSRGWTIMLPT